MRACVSKYFYKHAEKAVRRQCGWHRRSPSSVTTSSTCRRLLIWRGRSAQRFDGTPAFPNLGPRALGLSRPFLWQRVRFRPSVIAGPECDYTAARTRNVSSASTEAFSKKSLPRGPVTSVMTTTTRLLVIDRPCQLQLVCMQSGCKSSTILWLFHHGG